MERIGYLAWMDTDALLELTNDVSRVATTDTEVVFVRVADGELDRRWFVEED